MASVNKKLLEYIRNNDVSLSEVAKKIGVAQSSLSRSLNSDDLKISQLVEITKALKLPVTYFFDGNENVSSPLIEDYNNKIIALENELSIFRSVVNKKIFDYVSLLLSNAFKKESKQIKDEVLKRQREALKSMKYPINIVTFELDDYAKDELHDAVCSAIDIIKKEQKSK